MYLSYGKPSKREGKRERERREKKKKVEGGGLHYLLAQQGIVLLVFS